MRRRLRLLALARLLPATLLACFPAPAPVPHVSPGSEPAEPQTWTGAEAMNTEFYIGTKEEEAEEFARFAHEIRDIQEKQAADHHQPIERAFHAKAHGCLWGQITPWPNRDRRTRHGVFADPPRSYPVWVRYSNGVGWSQSDKENDARGMAVKLMGVHGKKYDVDEQATQDFLMTNAPTPVGKNAEEFMTFAHANAKGLFPSLLFLGAHPVTAGPALLRTGPIQSAVTEQYWSGGAYHLGPNQAIKYTAKPCEGSPSRTLLRDNPDYLRGDLDAAAKGGLCYTLYVQFQVDPVETPIEDASKEWRECMSPLIRVADITMPPQDADSPEEAKLCDSLSFNPWHAIPAHKPMGHINRARRFVYGASRVYRHGGHEPVDFEGFDKPKPLPP